MLIGDAEIGPASAANYLGIAIDCNDNFNENIGRVSRKISSSVFLPRRLLCLQSPNLLLLAYYWLKMVSI